MKKNRSCLRLFMLNEETTIQFLCDYQIPEKLCSFLRLLFKGLWSLELDDQEALALGVQSSLGDRLPLKRSVPVPSQFPGLLSGWLQEVKGQELNLTA